MSSAIDGFMKTREKYQSDSKISNILNGNQKREQRENIELKITGDKNQGYLTGVFMSDKNDAPYRLISGVRNYWISEEFAKKYGIGKFIRIADSKQYKVSDSVKAKIDELAGWLEKVEKEWDAWCGTGISKFAPSYRKIVSIQYMKVVSYLDLSRNPRELTPGVKLIVAESKAFYSAFESYIESQQMATGGYEFIDDLLGRGTLEAPKKKSNMYIVKVSRPKSYEVTISSAAKEIELNEEDLKKADDLDKEYVDCSSIDEEYIDKWIKMFEETEKEIIGKASEGSKPAEVIPGTKEPEVKIATNDDSDSIWT